MSSVEPRLRRPPDEPRDESLYVLANAAIWAGDYSAAERFLINFLDGHRRRVSPYADPVVSSAQRTMRQIRRRRREFQRLRNSASLSSDELVDEPAIIISAGNHLRGALWRRNECNFQLRAYLADLTWESQFFSKVVGVAGWSQNNGSWPSVVSSALPHGFEGESNSSVTAFYARWVVEGDLFVEAVVSEFATLVANGIWTKRILPGEATLVIEPFQKVLDTVDPAELP